MPNLPGLPRQPFGSDFEGGRKKNSDFFWLETPKKRWVYFFRFQNHFSATLKITSKGAY